jgi:hypothetical protein
MERANQQISQQKWRSRMAKKARMVGATGLPKITESRPDDERITLLNLVAKEAAECLNVSLDTDSPDTIVRAVNDCVRMIQKGRGPIFPADSEVDLLLGCLWASQIVKELNWEWVNLIFHDHNDSKAVGIVAPNRDLAIYPFHFVFGCIENNATVTILLSYNMLKERGKIPDLPPRSYENVMEHIHHLVPPD